MATPPPPADSSKVELVLSHLNELPALAPVAVRLLQMTGQADAELRDVVRLIESDAALAARIVGLASRAERASRVSHMTVDRATVMLGFRRVRQVVLATSIVSVFTPPADQKATAFDRRAFWTHSLAAACAARLLAAHRKPPCDPDEAFLAALLHDLGKIALATCMPRSYDRVVQAAQRSGGDLLMLERELIGADHTVAGRRLAQRWQLPEPLAMCLWLHHLPPDALPDSASDSGITALTWLADLLVRSQRLGYSGNHAATHSLDEAAELAGVDPRSIGDVVRALPGELEARTAWAGLDDVRATSAYAEALANTVGEVAALTAERSARQPEARSGGPSRALAALLAHTSPQSTITDTACAAARAVVEFTGRPAAICFALATRQVGGVVYGSYSAADHKRDMGVALIRPDELELAVEYAGADMPCIDAKAGVTLHAPNAPFQASLAHMLPADMALQRWSASHGLSMAGDASFLPVCVGRQLLAIIVATGSPGHDPAVDLPQDDADELLLALRAALQMSLAMTRARELEEELVAAQTRLTAAQRELATTRGMHMTAEMAAGAAHELNTPLAVISGHAQIVRSQSANASVVRSAEAILTAAHAASDTVTDLMRYSEPVVPSPAILPLQSTVPDWLAEIRIAIGRADIQWQADAAVPAIRCDARQLRHSLEQLIRNAADATADRHEQIVVKLQFSPSDDMVRLSVVDRGCGMPPHVREQAFHPFFSARAAGRKRGMGLALAQRYMLANGARITLDSQVGHGTTATIHLPFTMERDS